MQWVAVLMDDDELVHAALKLMLPTSWRLKSYFKPAELPLKELASAHVFICDMHFSPGSQWAEGLDLIAQVHQAYPNLPIMAISGDLNLNVMESGLQRGARYFLAKPIHSAELQHRLEEIQQYWIISQLPEKSASSVVWVGNGPASQRVLAQISRLRTLDHPVLIEGETGCGKEVAARLIGEHPPAPFVAVNVASIPENLFEAEFFGYQKGAFTGADQTRPGLVEQANGGTLFLDEIEALPLSQQPKLLRFLETYEGRRIGSNQTYRVKTRVIAATNVPLNRLVAEGRFREDLYFRLSQAVLRLPALRERVEDIAWLVTYFSRPWQDRFPKVWTPEAIQYLQQYSFPGNVRELKRLVETVHTHAPLPIIRPEDLKPYLTFTWSGEAFSSAQSGHLDQHRETEMASSLNPSNGLENQPAEFTFTWHYDWSLSYEENWLRWEKQLWQAFLKHHRPSQLWRWLKMPRSSFYKKLKQLGLNPDEESTGGHSHED